MSELRNVSDSVPKKPTEIIPIADLHDRVAEVYYGELGGKFQHETRSRIHWVCEKIQGVRVLDVRCSQGVTPILLAREEKIMTGVDASRQAIDEAEEYLANESGSTNENVAFIF